MRSKPFHYILRKLPFLLTVLLTPLTFFLIVHYNPSFLRFARDGRPEQEKETPALRKAAENTHGIHGSVQENESSGEGRLDGTPPRSFAHGKTPGPSSTSIAEQAARADVDDLKEWEEKARHCGGADDFCRLAAEAQDAGREDLARPYYLEALHLDPKHKAAHEALGDVCFDPLRDQIGRASCRERV